MKRIIHNAGCGSFCTETFYYHPFKEKPFFNVVYDCGSSDMKKEVQQEALNYFSHYGNIDLLFISHLDADHVNGIKALRQFMDGGTKVFLPFFEDGYRLLSGGGYFACYFDLVDFLTQNQIPIIYINADSEENEGESIGIEDLGNKTSYLSGAVIILPHCIWEYIPFNIQEESVDIDMVKEVCKDKKMTDEDIDSCINHQPINDEIQGKLKKVYNKISKTYTGVTAANMSSMLLISKESNNCDVIRSEVLRGWHTDINSSQINLKYTADDCRLNNASCLYTGDAGLKEKGFFKIVLKYYHKHLSHGVGIMQIPHHGTVHYYPNDLFNQINMEMAFVNITLSSSNPLFYAQIPFDFANKHIPLYIVTKEPYSKIESRIQLSYW
ncbi:MAG: hypothetical protein KBT27_04770 [Prevotellaceae bacterium]|nr:hypothetical protein [Candidatus Faecinaster equi]